ncbi:MAG: hypothetical protein QOE61_4655, partial [Micromonosporaceae bacterium]|nr:hypothetical protein [Micromonosporaceae bacterium]
EPWDGAGQAPALGDRPATGQRADSDPAGATTPFGPQVSLPPRRAHEAPADPAAERLDHAIRAFGQRAAIYLAENPPPAGVHENQARTQLAVVLAEAEQPGEGTQDWATLVGGGLALLQRTPDPVGYAATLPGVDPDRLTAGQSVSITAPALGNTRRESVAGDVLFVIADPDARNIARLAGDDSGRIMFVPSTRFQVASISTEPDGRRLVHLAWRPRTPTPADQASGGGARPATGQPTGAPQLPPLAMVPGRTESVPPSLERAILADYPELASAPEQVRGVMLSAIAARHVFRAELQQAQASYREYRAGLETRLIPVQSLGNCFFEALQVMVGPYLATLGISRNLGHEPSVSEMRRAIVQAIRDDFDDYRRNLGREDEAAHGGYVRRFDDVMALEHNEAAQRARLERHLAWIEEDGNWNAEDGDQVVEIAAHRWRLPLTALDPRNPRDFGRPSSAVERGYLWYNGSHYMGVQHHREDPARNAAALVRMPAEPVFVVPEGVDRHALTEEFFEAFSTLSTVMHDLPATADTARTQRAGRVARITADFHDAYTNAIAAHGLALDQQIGRLSDLYQNLGNVLREIRAAAGLAPSGPGTSTVAARPAGGLSGGSRVVPPAALAPSAGRVGGAAADVAGQRGRAVELPRGAAGRSGDGRRLEELWAGDTSHWLGVLDRLAGDARPPSLGGRPEGFPVDRGEAFSVYARARREHEAAAVALAAAQEAPEHSADPGSTVAVLRARELAARNGLGVARGWLSMWGITDAEAAWRAAGALSAEIAAAKGATRTSGLDAGASHAAAQPGPVLRFGDIVTAVAPVPGLFVVGLEFRAEGLLLYHGGGHAAIRARLDDLETSLRSFGWRGETLVILTERRAGDGIGELIQQAAERLRADIFVPAVGARVENAGGVLQTRHADGAEANLWERHESQSLRHSIPVPQWFVQDNGQISATTGTSRIEFPGGFASMDVTDFLEHGHLLESQGEPRLFDLRLRRGAQGGLGLADHQGRFVPLTADLRPTLPSDIDGIRLILDNGVGVRESAAVLATHYGIPVWVTPARAVVGLSDRGRLMASDRGSGAGVPGAGVAWVQVMPDGERAAQPPWYDTTSGMFEAPPGNAKVIKLRRPDDEAYGLLIARR